MYKISDVHHYSGAILVSLWCLFSVSLINFTAHGLQRVSLGSIKLGGVVAAAILILRLEKRH